MMATERLEEYLTLWEPRTHCSNCQHCIVRGKPQNPVAVCEAGHSRRKEDDGAAELVRLLRPRAPYSFRAARYCEDYDSMDDEGEPE